MDTSRADIREFGSEQNLPLRPLILLPFSTPHTMFRFLLLRRLWRISIGRSYKSVTIPKSA